MRSDTNVEDLDNFNGAGLNLTVFNRKSLDDIYDGLKEVWASPFEFRSFSWRQTLIDDPLWVLSSVVILEVGAERQVGRAGDRRSSTPATPGKMTGGDVGRRRRRGRRHLGRDAAVVAAGRRAGHAVQVAVAQPAAARRRQRDRAGDRQRHRARAGRAEADHRRRPEDHRDVRRRCTTRRASRGRGTSSSASRTASSGSSSAGRSSATTQLKNIPALAPLEGAERRARRRQRCRSRRSSDEGARVAATRRVARARSPSAGVARCCRCAAFARAGGERHDLGRQRAAAGRLLPLVRAVLLHRLRAARRRIRSACTSSLSRGNQVRVTVVLGDAGARRLSRRPACCGGRPTRS